MHTSTDATRQHDTKRRSCRVSKMLIKTHRVHGHISGRDLSARCEKALLRVMGPHRRHNYLSLQGYLAHKKLPPSLGPSTVHRHRATVGSYGGVGSRERGTPVPCHVRGRAELLRNSRIQQPKVACKHFALVQGRSSKIMSMIKWIRTSRLSIKNSLSFALPLEPL